MKFQNRTTILQLSHNNAMMSVSWILTQLRILTLHNSGFCLVQHRILSLNSEFWQTTQKSELQPRMSTYNSEFWLVELRLLTRVRILTCKSTFSPRQLRFISCESEFYIATQTSDFWVRILCSSELWHKTQNSDLYNTVLNPTYQPKFRLANENFHLICMSEFRVGTPNSEL